ncbi:MAG TPA: glycosyltransferase family 39 protein [Blastocatellia bacterium]
MRDLPYFVTRLRERLGGAISRTGDHWKKEVLGAICNPFPPLTWRRSAGFASIFLLAISVRALCWEDSRVEIARHETFLTGLVNSYRTEAIRMTNVGGLLFPNQAPESGDARMLVHPPGYSLLLVALKNITSYDAVMTLQVALDSITPIIVFLIAEELLGLTIAAVSALLVALSPHLAYYSLWLTPDSLVAVPTLLAIWFLIRGIKTGYLWPFIASGGMIGLSCWLRSNGLLLALFISIVVLLSIRKRRWRFATALTGAAVVVILPLTIRNLIVFGRLVPTSLGNGITMIEGIADYDGDGRFKMPSDDVQAAIMDSEWYNRPDYAQNLWAPDGVTRDRDRFHRGLGVVLSHPLWFATVMARRAEFMVRSNGSKPHDWPLNTSDVPIVSAEPAFGHWPSSMRNIQPAARISVVQLMQSGAVESNAADVHLSNDCKTLVVRGDQSAYGHQFASEPIPVRTKTDYLLDITVKLDDGAAAIEIMDTDGRVALASLIVPRLEGLKKKIAQKPKRAALSLTAPSTIEFASGQEMAVAHIVFSSGLRDSVRIVIGNNGAGLGAPLLEVGEADLYEYGPTPYWWTLYPRTLIHVIQKRIFVTSRMLPLVVIGLLVIGIFGHRQSLVLLASVPAYYMTTQSFLHTEYRYILPIHYFLFIFASVTICVAAGFVAEMIHPALYPKSRTGNPTRSAAPFLTE